MNESVNRRLLAAQPCCLEGLDQLFAAGPVAAADQSIVLGIDDPRSFHPDFIRPLTPWPVIHRETGRFRFRDTIRPVLVRTTQADSYSACNRSRWRRTRSRSRRTERSARPRRSPISCVEYPLQAKFDNRPLSSVKPAEQRLELSRVDTAACRGRLAADCLPPRLNLTAARRTGSLPRNITAFRWGQ